LVHAPAHDLRRGEQDLRPPVRRQRGDLGLRLGGARERLLDERLVREPHPCRLARVVREDDRGALAAGGRPARYEQRPRLGGGRRLGDRGHFVTSSGWLRMIVRRSGSACHQRSHSSKPMASWARWRTMSWWRYSCATSASTGVRVRTALASPRSGVWAISASSRSATTVRMRPPMRSVTMCCSLCTSQEPIGGASTPYSIPKTRTPRPCASS